MTADITTVGFIGSGMIGGTVARLSVAAGHAVKAYGAPYGPFSDETGTPASAARIRSALAAVHR